MPAFEFDRCEPTHNPYLTINSLLPMVSRANPGLIELLDVTLDVTSAVSNSWNLAFRLKHLFAEFGMPQIGGNLVLRQQRDGSVVADTVTEGPLSGIRSVRVTVSDDPEPHVRLVCSIGVDDTCPPLVIAGARRILTKALQRTAALARACGN
jgi:hypothetical protein